ncbi:MAG: hypothetical protein J6K75_05535, partial [Erysipelotrichaceae bacterium]|nr:hypothetical protein [Erysipelotrichaceae bacterium]
MKTINSIMLRRKNRLVIPEGYLLDEPSSDRSLQHMLSIANEMKQIGYVLSPHLATALLRINPKYLKDFYDELIITLKELVGADVEYKPMYKGFPETVIEKSDEELLMDQLFGYCLDFHSYLHDWFYGKREAHNFRDHFEFDEKKDITIPLDDSNIEYTVVRMAEMADAHNMFEVLMAQPEAFSRQDEQDLKWYFKNYAAVVKDHIPAEIPNKENLTLIIVLAHQNGVETVHKFKTATDVLRYAVK